METSTVDFKLKQILSRIGGFIKEVEVNFGIKGTVASFKLVRTFA